MKTHYRLQRDEETFHHASQACLSLGSHWEGPSLDEFIERVEHEFGAAKDLTRLIRTGLGPADSLAASDVRELCTQLGVPPEDFGVEPYIF